MSTENLVLYYCALRGIPDVTADAHTPGAEQEVKKPVVVAKESVVMCFVFGKV